MRRIEELINPEMYQVFLITSPATFPLTFAKHPWFVVNKKGTISRYEVAWRAGRYDEKIFWGHIVFNILPPFVGLRIFLFPKNIYSRGRLVKMIEGGEGSVASRMVEAIEKSPQNYPYINEYKFRGPNSNTYAQWILNQFPEANMRLSWNAFGRNYTYLQK